MTKELTEGLDRFFDQFASTRELVGRLIENKSHAQEILILLCARIDALACGAVRDDILRKKAFTEFVATYSGSSKLFESVSTGDLYYELDYHHWIMPGMLEKPGRFRLFSPLNDPVLTLLVESGIPLTLKDAQALIRRIQRILRKRFDVAPNQRQKRKPRASPEEVRRAIVGGFSTRHKWADKSGLEKGLGPIIASKTLGRLLYERFRSEAIHGGRVRVDETRFFSEAEPYWKPLTSDFYGPFQLVEFPAQFLTSLLSDCLKNYRKRLLGTGKLPPNLHFEIFPDDVFEHLDLLDETLLPRSRLAVPR